jgi:hypothetical protein
VKKRLLYIGISIAIIFVTTFAGLRVAAAPIHTFDHSWDAAHDIPVDAKITSMARRAQFDNYISGIPPIGRRKLILESASRLDSGPYYLFFYPSWVSDTLVVYHFTADGKILWKTCTWSEN